MFAILNLETNELLLQNLMEGYYRSNLSSSFLSTYSTIFKDINSVLKDYLLPIPLSFQ